MNGAAAGLEPSSPDPGVQDKSSFPSNNYEVKIINDGESLTGQDVLLTKFLKELEELKTGMTDLRIEVAWIRSHLEKQSPRKMSVCREDSLEEPTTPTRRGSTMLVKEVEMEHKDLIDQLREEGFIRNDKVYNVMLSVNFRNFQPDNMLPKKSYQINKAKFFERYILRVKEGSKVLYMFSNPYVAVCLALIVGSTGFVVTEGDSSTVAQVKKNYSFLIETKRLIIIDAKWYDFFSKGYGQKAPYDVIIVPKHYFTKAVAAQLDPETGDAYDPWDDTKLN